MDQKQRPGNNPDKNQVPQPKTIRYNELPQNIKNKFSQLEATHKEEFQKFKDWTSTRLTNEGYPPYLIPHYIGWIWQYKMKQKSDDQLFAEFANVALPLMTRYLKKNDPITIAFAKKIMRPPIEEDHSLDELEG